ncbi:MAG: hypothetical protein H7Z43_02610 [Clostridia bacterium]|nr:hypothetical protein [Deltaproteobacteria bacterium]
MKCVSLLLCFAFIAACADEDSQESTHIDEAKKATVEEAKAAFSLLEASVAGAFIDLRTTAKQAGSTNAARYTFMGYTQCNNSGFHSGGGTPQAVFTDCQDLPGEDALDGRFRYELEGDEGRDVERYSTTMTFGQTATEPDNVKRYVACTSELTVVHDGTSSNGSGTFFDIKVDDSWSFDA